jgi:uncharacterized cupredoxin-like copper-binding protein
VASGSHRWYTTLVVKEVHPVPDRRLPLIFAALALGVAGCGGGDGSSGDAAASPTAASQTQVAGRRTTITMSDYDFDPKSLAAKAGKLRLTVVNAGNDQHELVLIRTRKAPGALPVKDQQASQAGAVGEIPEQEAGKSASRAFHLERGSYVFICNIPGHYQSGMAGKLTVK